MAQETNEGIAYLMALKRSASPVAPAPATTNPEPSPGPQPLEAQSSFQGSEKRRSPRYRCEGSAEMCEVSCDVHTWATFTDISLHGCYMEAQATYPVGTVLRLKLEANGRRVEATGNVRVSYPYLGMGIAFVDLSEENQAKLRDLVLSLSRPCVIMGPGVPSSLPAARSVDALGPVPDPQAALQAVTEFFRDRQLLMWEDFLRIVRRSQPAGAAR